MNTKKSIKKYDCEKNEIAKHCTVGKQITTLAAIRIKLLIGKVNSKKMKETLSSLKHPNHINKI